MKHLLDRLGLPHHEILLVSTDLWMEYRVRERTIDKLKRLGTHPADVRAERAALNAWARRMRDQGMAGLWAIPMPRTEPYAPSLAIQRDSL